MIGLAVIRSVVQTEAAEIPTLPVKGAKWQSVERSPDVNLKLRGWQTVGLYKGLVSIGYPPDSPPDPNAPQLCTVFEKPRVPVFKNLYSIGVYSGQANGLEAHPPHMADFEMASGERVYAPTHGYNIGNGYGYLVVYADSDSIAIHVGDNDGTIDGYAIHFLNLTVDPEIVKAYEAANGYGRKVLPAVGKHQAIGTAKNGGVTVVVRDSGSFMDPRSALDWYSDCDGIDLGKIVPTDSTFGLFGYHARNYPPTFPPLNTLEACPGEIPVEGKINDLVEQPIIPPANDGLCNIQPNPDSPPKYCTDPQLAKSNPDFCANNNADWCYPENCTGAMAGVDFCEKASDPTCGGQWFGRHIRGFCLGDPGNVIYDSWVAYQEVCIKKSRAATAEERAKITADSNTISTCLAYFQSTGRLSQIKQSPNKSAKESPNQKLPACVPTTDRTKPKGCISECSQPIQIQESLKIFDQAGCLRTGTCRADIRITDGFYIPYAKELADYFVGVFDAEHQTPDELDRLQLALRNGPNDPDFEEAWQKSGRLVKVLPLEMQDELKCQFIEYVKERKERNLNTKYLDRATKPGEVLEFKVYDKNITEINCKPIRKNYPRPDLFDAAEASWKSQGWEPYWTGVPLFPNDESEGKIEFVSPTVFNTAQESTNLDREGRPIKIGPIYVSLPEIMRLNLATKALQRLYVPQEFIDKEITPVTIGKEITPLVKDLACTPTKKWEDYYSKTTEARDQLSLDLKLWRSTELSEYERGVDCKIEPLPGENDSEVCSVGPNGQLNCGLQLGATPTQGTGGGDKKPWPACVPEDFTGKIGKDVEPQDHVPTCCAKIGSGGSFDECAWPARGWCTTTQCDEGSDGDCSGGGQVPKCQCGRLYRAYCAQTNEPPPVTPPPSQQANYSCDANGNCNFTETVQVRTVFPHLYEIAEQTISPERGFLRQFKPGLVNALAKQLQNQGGMDGQVARLEAEKMFEKAFIPVPASISGVKYELVNSTGMGLVKSGHEESGWQIYFYRLGGVENAKNLIVELLDKLRTGN